MSNRELLERCLNVLDEVDQENISTNVRPVMYDIEAELSKPSRSDKSVGAIEILQLAHVEQAEEIEQLKSKLAEAEIDAKRFRYIRTELKADDTYSGQVLWTFLTNGHNLDDCIDAAISNNTKELG